MKYVVDRTETEVRSYYSNENKANPNGEVVLRVPLNVQRGDVGVLDRINRKIRVLIIDADRVARKRVRDMLGEDPEVEIIGECETGEDALASIRTTSPDLLILDIHLPEIDGFSLLESIPNDQTPAVIFVTAFDRYALRAFEVSALDYLLKPFGPDRFRKAMRRAKAQIRKEKGTAVEKKDLGRIAIRTGKKVFFLKSDEIDWIEAEGNSVRLHTGTQSHVIRASISSLESELDPEKFVRIHRSTIVNVDRVRWLEPSTHGNYRVVLHDGTQLILRRKEKLVQLTGKAARST
ncbi:MAG TPA: LytTR family DNA-binding domain-containing protein [Acidobacteriota bacterium]|nr:LytTR family DNA-binding domain-containing protein [Acidobacteriota bacterium]